MNPRRMDIEELKQLNPSMENPIELVCDDGIYTGPMKKIRVVAVYNDRLAFIDIHNRLFSEGEGVLKHYPSFKKEPKIEVLYEVLDNTGDVKGFYFEDGSYPVFRDKEKSIAKYPRILERKTGRKLFINMDTFELVEEPK